MNTHDYFELLGAGFYAMGIVFFTWLGAGGLFDAIRRQAAHRRYAREQKAYTARQTAKGGRR